MAFVISEVSMCNQALVELGANTINNLTEQTAEAIACNNIFDNLRRELLADHTWNFAIKQVELAQSTSTPLFDYIYKYALPTDLVKLNKVSDNVRFKVQQNFILTDAVTCKIEYVYDNADVSTWSASFVGAFIAALHWKLAYNLTASGAEQERANAIFRAALQKAKTLDSQGDVTDQYGSYDHFLIGSRL